MFLIFPLDNSIINDIMQMKHNKKILQRKSKNVSGETSTFRSREIGENQ
jgi:hypothetical protein